MTLYVLAQNSENTDAAKEAVKPLQDQYTVTGGDDLQWSLGVEVIDIDRRSSPHRLHTWKGFIS